LIGLFGSLPILLSVKQRTFYLVPSLPYFVLAIATLIYPYYIAITNNWKIGSKSIKYFKISASAIVLILCVYLGSKVGQIGRSHNLINTMNYFKTKFPVGQMIGICPENDYDY